MKAYEVSIITEMTPGHASFNNYDEIKQYLKTELMPYNNTSYSMDNLDQAIDDFSVLKAVRKKLTSKKKELEKAYTLPIEEVMSQLDELIDMVKVPYTVVDRFLKAHEKDIKKREILAYSKVKSEILGIYSYSVVNSNAFFNPRWLNKTYAERQWKYDVDKKIQNAFNDINLIRELGGENVNALLAFYFDKLSLDGVDAFLETLSGGNETEQTKEDYEPEPPVVIVDPETGEILYDESEGAGNGGDSPSNPTNPDSDTPVIRETEMPLPGPNVQKDDVEIVVMLRGTIEAVTKYKKEAASFGVSIEEVKYEDIQRKVNGFNARGTGLIPDKMEGKKTLDRQGAPWDFNEDDALREEFSSNMTISEIAKAHGRTYGAIRARLKKFGLIE